MQNVKEQEYCPFPPSIDPKGKDGLPNSLSKFFRDYYFKRRLLKKRFDIKSVSEQTGLRQDFIEARFEEHRKSISKPRHRSLKDRRSTDTKDKTYCNSDKNGCIESKVMISTIESKENFNELHYQYFNEIYFPSPPMTPKPVFTYIPPLNQPLTIEIPDHNLF